MNTYPSAQKNSLLAAILAIAMTAQAGPTDLSTVPLSTYNAPSSVDVKPNILFVLDDSGSMDWDGMPDQASWYISNNSEYRPAQYNSSVDSGMPPYMRRNSAFNGVAYNPAIRYLPPLKYNADGTLDTATYPSMAGVSTATGGDSSASSSSRNWNAVKQDGFGVQSTSTTNLTSAAYAFVTIPGEFCDKPDLRTCTTSNAATGIYTYPALMRWCTTANLTSCRATWDSSNTHPRMPAPRIATITVSGSNNAVITGIIVGTGGPQIMSGSTASSSTNTTVATRIRDAINNCSNVQTGNCTAVGYSATVNGSTVTIYAPGVTTATPAVTNTGTVSTTTTAFAQSTIPLPNWRDTTASPNESSAAIPGENLRHTITPSITSYPYPGSATKAAGRTDCAGTTCTYEEEMTNYANWYAYYRTRMQLMKTAASRSFAGIDTAEDIAANRSRFRVGYLSLNNNTESDFLNLDEFKTSHKNDWYTKLLAANPSSGTPLRYALSRAGSLYAGKYNGTTLNGSTVIDPLQYSCQQNYTILSTDGFWNGSAGFKLNGTSAIGNQDGSMQAPYNDGGVATTQQRTSSLQSRTETQTAERGTLQSRASQLQTRTSTLQASTSNLETRTSSDSGATWTAWTSTSSCTPDNSGGSRRQCQYTPWTAWVDVASCDAVAQDTSGTWSVGTARQCQYSAWSAWQGTATCSQQNKDGSDPYTVGLARECQTAATTAYADTPSCAVTAPDASGNFTECQYNWAAAAATQTCTPAYVANNFDNSIVFRNCGTTGTTWSNVSSCTASNWSNTGTRTACQYTGWSGWSTVTSCTAVDQSAGPDYTVGTAVGCQTTSVSGGNSDTLADVAAYYYNTDLRNPDASAGTGTCDGPIIAPATTPTNLCNNNFVPNDRDVAPWQHMTTFTLGLGAQGKMLFSPTYWTDTSGDFSSVKNGVTADPTNGICSWMTSGNRCVWPTPSADSPANIDDLWHAAVNGRGSYFSATDPSSLAAGLGNALEAISESPRPGTSAAAASSNPNVSAGDNYVFSSYYKSVDWYGDLYRQRFDITTQDLTSQLDWSATAMLDCATTPWVASKAYIAGSFYRNGTACYLVTTGYVAGSTFSSTDTDNTAIVADTPAGCSTAWAASTAYSVGSVYSQGGVCQYVIKAYTSGATYGSIDTQNTNAAFVSGTPSTRTIYTKGSSGLTSFVWDNLTTAQQAYFSAPHLTYVAGPPASGLSQFCTPASASCLSATAQSNTTVAAGGAAGEALINFLRGDRSNEGTWYRERKHVLGDIVSSEARYVKVPLFNYTDSGYSAYKLLKSTRSGAVYVGSNDGMMHGFDAETGKELWAYIPEPLLPKLHQLADKSYSQKHQYYVDGTPETGDVCPSAPTTACTSAQWKTILVGGLNGGGKGYYALDVTDPANPALLWEFTDSTLGYTYGNPRITKLKTGQWVVLVTSGYNNADGIGRLYVLDAYTGSLIRTISTGAGSASTPSGLAKISAHSTTADTNNTTAAVYGGDMLGNVWRFDINGDIGETGYDAQLLVTLVDSSGNRQPITAKPVLTTINNKPVVFVGTGSYLGISDITNTQSQTMYAIKDNLGSTTYGNPRTLGSNFVAQTMVGATCGENSGEACTAGESIRKINTSASVNWTTQNGWYLDFLTAGERSNTDPTLALGTLVFTTNTPNNASALPCGDDISDTTASWFYSLDYLTGGPVTNSGGVVATSLGNVIATRPVLIRLPDGTVLALIRTSGGASSSTGGGGSGGAAAGYFPGGKEDGKTLVKKPPINITSGGSRRVSWREITN